MLAFREIRRNPEIDLHDAIPECMLVVQADYGDHMVILVTAEFNYHSFVRNAKSLFSVQTSEKHAASLNLCADETVEFLSARLLSSTASLVFPLSQRELRTAHIISDDITTSHRKSLCDL
jgi:hypothetical protein